MKDSDFLKDLRKPLDVEQIDFRIQSISKKGFATILAYKDARVDMNRLDDVLAYNWQTKYELIDGQLFCSIGILVNGEWIWRQDVGVESYTEAEKGRASDAFKRAGFRWGIGRELYDYPRITLMLRPDEFTVKDNKAKQTYKLQLHKWVWKIDRDKDGNLKKLTAKDEKGALRFDSAEDFNGVPKVSNTQPKSQPKSNDNGLVNALKEVTNSKDVSELERVWNNHSEFQASSAFKKAVNNRKNELTK